AARANCSANMDTPPEPSTSTVAPGLSGGGVSIRPCHAVTAAQGSVAASSKDRCAGTCTASCSSSTAYSASIPSTGPPWVVGGGSLDGPSTQPRKKVLATRSPCLKRVTSLPTSTTSPAPSERGMV